MNPSTSDTSASEGLSVRGLAVAYGDLRAVDGVDLDYGVTTTNHIEASLHKQMIASVQKVIVLADSSKFGRRGFSKICDMSAVDQIITDDKAPASVIERLQESGVDVTVVPVGRRE